MVWRSIPLTGEVVENSPPNTTRNASDSEDAQHLPKLRSRRAHVACLEPNRCFLAVLVGIECHWAERTNQFML